MKRELYDYFSSLESLRNKKDGLIHSDSVDIELVSPSTREKKVPMYTINGERVYIKGNDATHSAVGLATSLMYNDIGFLTPVQHILTTSPSNRRIFTRARNLDPRFTDISIVTKDIMGIPNIESDTMENILSQKDKFSASFRLGRYAWQFLYDPDVRAIMLEYMTRDTYDEIVGDSLVSEARTDIDRHFLNEFLYKKKGDKKYTGFIPIDLDNLELLRYIYGSKFTDDNFDEFLVTPYESTAITGKLCSRPYCHRIADLKEIIDDGVVPPASLDKLKAALSYDLPGAIRDSMDITGL